MLPIVMSFLDRDWKEKAAALACRYEFANGYRFSFFAIRSYTKLMVVKEDCFLFFSLKWCSAVSGVTFSFNVNDFSQFSALEPRLRNALKMFARPDRLQRSDFDT